MNELYRKFKLSNKLSFIVLLSIVISFAILGVYFDSFLKESYNQDTKKRMLHGYNRVALDFLNSEKTLKEGIDFVQTSESLLASIDLINNYQDKKNYNAILLDEEKKAIARELLSRVKLSLNNDIALYDKNEELIAYVTKDVNRYRMNYFSYKNGLKLLYSKYEDEDIYTQREMVEYELVSHKHKSFYLQRELLNNSVITYHLFNGYIFIKSHKNIFEENNDTAVAHIEMSLRRGEAYFRTLSDDFSMDVTTSVDGKYALHSYPLLDRNTHNRIKILDTDEDLTGAMSLKTENSPLYIVIKMKKSTLNIKLHENRVKLFLILFIVSFIILLTVRFLFKQGLARPLEILMKQIDKIEHRDYSQTKQLSSGDELETISKNINTLAFTIRSRESALQKSQENLEYLSTHDTLTNLPNRRFFNQRLKHSIEMAKRNKTQVTLIFLDLDNFKEINDSLGHDIGDELLKEVSKRLSSNLRTIDTLARIGGDEFYILIESVTKISEIETVVHKILDDFKNSFLCNTHEIKTTASIGISIYPQDGKDSITLIKNADLAMYQAKKRGGDSFNFFSESLSINLEERLEQISAIRVAVNSCDEFYLLYQPKISANNGKIIAVEALVRWNSSKLGFMRPDQFIPLAEETTLIVPLGRWILEKACSDFMQLQNDGYDLEHISINVSAIQLLHSDMISTLEDTLKKTLIDPRQVELEITESYIATNEHNSLKTLHKFRDMNISLAIDDFGTGFSSLSYLQKLPVTRLKIDKSFVDNIPDSDESVAVAKAIIALAKTFNLSITAEGVETKEQLEFLRNMGCNEIQGYYYSKPLSIEELKDFYTNQNIKQE